MCMAYFFYSTSIVHGEIETRIPSPILPHYEVNLFSLPVAVGRKPLHSRLNRRGKVCDFLNREYAGLF